MKFSKQSGIGTTDFWAIVLALGKLLFAELCFSRSVPSEQVLWVQILLHQSSSSSCDNDVNFFKTKFIRTTDAQTTAAAPSELAIVH